jgi:dipeptidyl aminopeptidase/acylaminoacyl peptidase
MTIKLFNSIRPALACVFWPIGIVAAEHQGLDEFNRITSEARERSRVPVPDAEVPIAFSADDQTLFFGLGPGDARVLARMDPATGKWSEKIATDFRWREIGLDAEGRPRLRTENGWRQWSGESWEPAADPETDSEERKSSDGSGRRHRGWTSPDGRARAVVEDDALFLEIDGGSRRELIPAEASHVFRDPPVWTADSSRFAIWRTRDVEEYRVHLVETSPDDQVQPKHSTYEYPKPGDEIDTRLPWIGFIDEREPIEPDASLAANPYQTRRLAWRGDHTRLTYEFIERGFGLYRIVEIDSESGDQRALVDERSDTFVFVHGNTYRHDLDDGAEIIWMSERDGWRHLYLLDGRDGSVKRRLTEGPWIVREVVEVDEENRELLVKIAGYHSDQDPYLVHYARVDLDGGEMIPLTESPGTHDRFERSPGGNYYTCRWSRVDHPPVTELRRWRDGRLLATLARADADELKAGGWRAPIPLRSKDREGKFDIHGMVILPPDFDPAKRYPVVESIYAGPHGAFVPKSWSTWHGTMSEFAAFGFIVVKIDGRGTNHRCREFHHFAHQNLRDSGLPDRIAWMRAAAAEFPQMDLDRVGIYGGSAGGQSALAALLFHGDFYRAAAADCGCHDNRVDKLWWNEQWMGWPIGPQYAENSNVTHADKLRGALLLTVGELDRNVDPSSTYQVVDALIRADKDFEFLPLTGKGHGAGETRYGKRRRVDFFRRHLGGPRTLAEDSR